MISNKETYQIIKNSVKSYLADAEVFLFGSRARNNYSEASDFDILIITKNQLTPKQKINLKTNIRKSLLNKDIRSDILIQSKNEIMKKEKLPGHIIKDILKDSTLL